jgi:internalin A
MGTEVMADVKLLLLGNGEAGKTQIARWLAGKSFDPIWNTTHGIQIGAVPLPGTPPARLQIWDFGGQDIYHGTHSLFLRSPAVLMLVWAKDTEQRESYEPALLNLKQCCADVRAFEIRILASSIEKQFVLDGFMQI